jgi:hypothetical protein
MTTIFVIASMIGAIVPLLLIIVLFAGIERSPFDEATKQRYKIISIASAAMWAAVIWGLGIIGVFSYHAGDVIPRFLVPLLVPVLFGLNLLRKHDFRTILNHTPLSLMVGMQTFRLLGVLFIVVVNADLAPKNFVTGGYGDIITGSLALLAGIMLKNDITGAHAMTWSFMTAGVVDLLNVAFMLLYYYPTWSNAQPSSAGATEFPLILVLGLAAPFALTFHFYTLRTLLVRVVPIY